MFQESEVVCLVVAVAFIICAAFLHRVIRLPRLPVIYAAILALVCGHVFTVLEDVAYYDLFNLLEHVSYAASAVLFAAGTWMLARTAEREGTQGQ